MKNNIEKLKSKEAEKILKEIMDVYLERGFGVMNKTEFETLLYHVFKKNGLLTGKCFDDSLKLQITESKARKLIYESQIRYEKREKNDLDAYLRISLGIHLKNAHFVKNKTNDEIRFAIEDKYLRVALNAKLRECDYFADTSFNKDIVSLNKEMFEQVITLLVPNFDKDEVLERLKSIDNLDEKGKEIVEVFKEKLKGTSENVILDLISVVMEKASKVALKCFATAILG